MAVGIEDVERKVEPGAAVDERSFAAALKGAIQARSTVTYLVWKELEARFGGDVATEVLAAAHRRYGRLAGQGWGEVADAGEALLAQTSKGGYLVFGQRVVECGPQYARKDFSRCPHVEAFRRLGATDEEVRTLCQDVLSQGDYGNLDPHDGIELVFGAQIGAGDDHCEYCLRRVAKG